MRQQWQYPASASGWQTWSGIGCSEPYLEGLQQCRSGLGWHPNHDRTQAVSGWQQEPALACLDLLAVVDQTARLNRK